MAQQKSLIPYMGVSKNSGFPQNGWFIMENPIKHGMIWGVKPPLFFGKHPYDWTYDDFVPSCGSMSSVPTLVLRSMIGYLPTKYITHVKPVIFGEPENLVQGDLDLPPATKKRPVSPEACRSQIIAAFQAAPSESLMLDGDGEFEDPE